MYKAFLKLHYIENEVYIKIAIYGTLYAPFEYEPCVGKAHNHLSRVYRRLFQVLFSICFSLVTWSSPGTFARRIFLKLESR